MCLRSMFAFNVTNCDAYVYVCVMRGLSVFHSVPPFSLCQHLSPAPPSVSLFRPPATFHCITISSTNCCCCCCLVYSRTAAGARARPDNSQLVACTDLHCHCIVMSSQPSVWRAQTCHAAHELSCLMTQYSNWRAATGGVTSCTKHHQTAIQQPANSRKENVCRQQPDASPPTADHHKTANAQGMALFMLQ